MQKNSAVATRCPHYDLVPKGWDDNLAFRIEMLERGRTSKEDADDLWRMCRDDLLFFANVFVWVIDPRKIGSDRHPEGPFISYAFQDRTMLEILDAIENQHDYCILKSRDMGASWMCLIVMAWLWLFHPMTMFLLASRVKDDVDDAGNPKSMFVKLDYLLSKLPGWLKPPMERTSMHLRNLRTGSSIDGTSTQENMGRSDRRTAVLFDEFAAVDNGHAALAASRDVSGCRIFNSTPQGVGNAFYDMWERCACKTRLHWSEHPEKARGLYTSVDGKLEIIDLQYQYPAGYEFVLDGKLRSPWYDGECARAANSQEIAQELDCDFLGSGWQAFPQKMLDAHKAKFARPPFLVGDLEYDAETCEPLRFHEHPKGSMRLWVAVNAAGKVPNDQEYVVGADISMGTGSSNSTISVYGRNTREKVAEFANAHIDPIDHAKLAMAVGKWFRSPGGEVARLIWENNGPGATFRKAVVLANYPRIYYQRDETHVTRKVSSDPGWNPTTSNKSAMLSSYRNALATGAIVNRSAEAVDECSGYVNEPNGEWVFAKAKNSYDPTGAKKNHGDRVIADALCWLLLEDIKPVETKLAAVAPPGSFGHRRMLYEQKQRRSKYRI